MNQSKTTLKKTIRNHVLTSEAFRSLVQLTTKAMSETASFDPINSAPNVLRGKYNALYARCAELFSDETLEKEERDQLVYLSYGIKVKSFDFVQGALSITFLRTVSGVEKQYVLNVVSESYPYLTTAINDSNPEDAQMLINNYSKI